MNKIYVEVPITTNQTTLSIPCGDDESLGCKYKESVNQESTSVQYVVFVSGLNLC